jgi:hypothetical protein
VSNGLASTWYGANRGGTALVVTAAPQNSNASVDITIAGGNSTGHANISFDKASPTTTTAPGGIQYDLGSDAMSFSANRTTAMTIVSTGNVIIGSSTAPGSTQLALVGSGSGASTITMENTGNSAGSGYSGINFYNNAGALVAGINHSNSNTTTLPGSTWMGSRSSSEAVYLVAGTLIPSPRLTILPTGYIGVSTTAPTTALEVNGTISATNFVGNGSGLTGITATGDRIVSGSVNMIAELTSGTVRVSGTLAMVNTGNEVCGPATWNSIRVDPVTHFVQVCRP